MDEREEVTVETNATYSPGGNGKPGQESSPAGLIERGTDENPAPSVSPTEAGGVNSESWQERARRESRKFAAEVKTNCQQMAREEAEAAVATLRERFGIEAQPTEDGTAMVDGVEFILDDEEGTLHMLQRCPSCHEMLTGLAITGWAELGRQLERFAPIPEHSCPAVPDPAFATPPLRIPDHKQAILDLINTQELAETVDARINAVADARKSLNTLRADHRRATGEAELIEAGLALLLANPPAEDPNLKIASKNEESRKAWLKSQRVADPGYANALRIAEGYRIAIEKAETAVDTRGNELALALAELRAGIATLSFLGGAD